MDTEKIWNGVRSRIKIYLEERDKIKKEILERRSEIHVSEILDKVWNLYGCRLSELRTDPVLGDNAMKADLLEYYLILCQSYEIIPKV